MPQGAEFINVEGRPVVYNNDPQRGIYQLTFTRIILSGLIYITVFTSLLLRCFPALKDVALDYIPEIMSLFGVRKEETYMDLFKKFIGSLLVRSSMILSIIIFIHVILFYIINKYRR